MWPLPPIAYVALATALELAAFAVFARVREDYLAHGHLSRAGTWLQLCYFGAYALSSYLFLDSRLPHVSTEPPLFAVAVAALIAGLLLLVLSMPVLGRRSFGADTGTLNTSGLYRWSRNPQLVGFALVVAGYAGLWPSWRGALYLSVVFVISHEMVRAEEDHLADVFGQEYEDYCLRTPRYIGPLRRG